MPHEFTVVLGWPPKECNPNARGHWSKRHRAAKRYRKQCWALATVEKNIHGNPAKEATERGSVHMHIDFYPPNRVRRDDDNLIAAFKAGRDGVADALGCDDQVFRIYPFLSDEVRKGGEVVVTIERREKRESS